MLGAGTETDANHHNKFTVYNVEIHNGSLTWTISKRYRDFVALNKVLSESIRREIATDPVIPTDFLVKTPTFTSSTDGVVIAQRKIWIGNWLSKLFSITEASGDKSVLEFVGLVKNYDYQDNTPSVVKNAGRREVDINSVPSFVNVGDIILVHNNSTTASIVRKIIVSDWDHVAIIVPRPRRESVASNTGGLMVFEAVNDGVILSTLESRLYDYEQSDRLVALRKLHWKRSQKSIEALEAFVKETVGQKYSLRGLIQPKRRQSVAGQQQLHADPKKPAESNVKNTYYCSELVVETLRTMGVMEGDVGALLPSHFGSDQEEKIQAALTENTARFSKEVLICYDKKRLEVSHATVTPYMSSVFAPAPGDGMDGADSDDDGDDPLSSEIDERLRISTIANTNTNNTNARVRSSKKTLLHLW